VKESETMLEIIACVAIYVLCAIVLYRELFGKE